VLQTVRRRPLARQIQAVFAITSLGFLTFLQLPSKAEEIKNQPSQQEQSVLRDQAYVRQLLEKGSSDANVESFLKLSSAFASFSPSGDFHAYALKLIAKEKTALKQAKQTKQTQQAAVRTESTPTAVVAETAPVAVAGNVAAPSNLVGIGSIKASQESNRENNQDNNVTSTLESNQAAVSSPSPSAPVFGGGVFLPPVSASSNAGGFVPATSL